MSLIGAPPPRSGQDGPALAELMTALPVATLVIRPDNRIADANVRAEMLLNMARSAIVGSDGARTRRIADTGRMAVGRARFDLWHSNLPIAAYAIQGP
ncbi:MAG: two-component sensor histidine kinase, partial [Sphingobium sp.]